MAAARVHKKAKPSDIAADEDDEDEDRFMPDDDASADDPDDNISPEVRALMAKFNKVSGMSTGPDEPEITCTKIYYASRTHSQLTQTLPEMRRLKLSPPESNEGGGPQVEISIGASKKRKASIGEDGGPPASVIRSVSLGSRKQLCINDELRARTNDLDESCRQLLNEKGDRRCKYLPPPGEDTAVHELRDQILATPKDIEELAQLGRLSGTCPYFGSRAAIPQAQLVTLPYNLLLQQSAREALNIDLKDQILVIDEAHNLIPTLLSLSSVLLPFSTLSLALAQLAAYYARFRTRLAAKHSLHLVRCVALLKALQGYVTSWKDAKLKEENSAANSTEIVTVGELMSRLGRKVEGINLLEINAYIRSSKLARKINSYSEKVAEKAAGDDPAKLARLRRSTNPPLHVIEEFLLALTSASDDGRISLALSGDRGKEQQVEIKYQLLNPAVHFARVLEDARSVILAGGTMSPMSDYVNQLFAHLPANRLSTFSCGHIIPSQNLQALVVSKGPRGSELEFKYGNRGDASLIAELGQILLNFASVVPAGMVVFLPSYTFLNAVTTAWTASGILSKLNAKKKVFSEPQGSEVEPVLRDYAAEVNKPPLAAGEKKPGAIMLAVVGAKLSEGLNFSDDLARAVIIVGVPFPNIKSPELQERMNYIKRTAKADSALGGRDPATELYENMAMNAINQSIGRAIRHGGDWASLLLVDKRYGNLRIRQKLPKWISESVRLPDTFGGTIKELGGFYREIRARQAR